MPRLVRAALVAAAAVLVTACATALCPGGANCPTDGEQSDNTNNT